MVQTPSVPVIEIDGGGGGGEAGGGGGGGWQPSMHSADALPGAAYAIATMSAAALADAVNTRLSRDNLSPSKPPWTKRRPSPLRSGGSPFA